MIFLITTSSDVVSSNSPRASCRRTYQRMGRSGKCVCGGGYTGPALHVSIKELINEKE